MAKIAVIYYSSTGNVHQLAAALAEGAEEAGAEVRLRRVASSGASSATRRRRTSAPASSAPSARAAASWCTLPVDE